MSLYGRTMLKIKMIVTGGRAQIMIQWWMMMANLMNNK
jgi:hypothetical protein